MTDPIKSSMRYTQDLFAHLEEFFARATGKSAAEFAKAQSFVVAFNSGASEYERRQEAALHWLNNEIIGFYTRRAEDAFQNAQQLGGMKLMLGGGGIFNKGRLDSVSSAVLYSDTVLIPDPVMLWVQGPRPEDKYGYFHLLHATYTLLQLKPLVDADLPYPPIVVFPNREVWLDKHDSQTLEGFGQLLLDVLSNSLGENFADLQEVADFAGRNFQRFRDVVDRNHLCVAPGGSINEPLEQALVRIEKHYATWESEEWCERYRGWPIHQRIFDNIGQRISRVYHLLENAQKFRGQPLIYGEQHAHYFRLVSQASSARLEKLKVLGPRTTALVNALGSHRLRWLAGFPADTLAKLRLDNENVTFRKQLAASVARLHESDLNDVDRVAAEVCHDLVLAIDEHKKKVFSIEEKYNRDHVKTLVLAVAAGAALIPALGPFLGGAPPLATLIGKYGHDKLAEHAEKRKLTQSLMGVVAAAQPED